MQYSNVLKQSSVCSAIYIFKEQSLKKHIQILKMIYETIKKYLLVLWMEKKLVPLLSQNKKYVCFWSPYDLK